MRPFFPFFLLLVAVATTPRLQADDLAALKDRLHKADVENSLVTLDMRPWHLAISFQLFNSKGQQTETGTIEEWWASPKLHKTIYISPSFTNTEIVNDEGDFKLSASSYAPEIVQRLREQIVRPMPDAKDIDDSVPYFEKKDISKVPLECIMLARPMKGAPFPPLGLFPTYCLDHDKNSLRASFDSGLTYIIRNRMGVFLGRSVALDQSIFVNGIVVAKAHIEKLATLPTSNTDGTFAVHEGMTKIEADVQVPGSVVAGGIIRKVQPVYPDIAKAHHVSGTVTVNALIGTDGHIQRLKLLSTPDPDLAIAALSAVRQWTYKPYLLNGQPVNVDTTITVNFAFGPPH